MPEPTSALVTMADVEWNCTNVYSITPASATATQEQNKPSKRMSTSKEYEYERRSRRRVTPTLPVTRMVWCGIGIADYRLRLAAP